MTDSCLAFDGNTRSCNVLAKFFQRIAPSTFTWTLTVFPKALTLRQELFTTWQRRICFDSITKHCIQTIIVQMTALMTFLTTMFFYSLAKSDEVFAQLT